MRGLGVPEIETTLGVPREAVEDVLRRIDHAPPVILGGARLTKRKRERALYLFLENDDPLASDRIVIDRPGGGFRARRSSKRWVGETKYELRCGEARSLEACGRFLNGRPITSAFVKHSRGLVYRGAGRTKVRLDEMMPVSPSEPWVRGEPFWDLEVEGAEQATVDQAVALLFGDIVERYGLSEIEVRKVDRAALFAPLDMPTLADLRRLVGAALPGAAETLR